MSLGMLAVEWMVERDGRRLLLRAGGCLPLSLVSKGERFSKMLTLTRLHLSSTRRTTLRLAASMSSSSLQPTPERAQELKDNIDSVLADVKSASDGRSVCRSQAIFRTNGFVLTSSLPSTDPTCPHLEAQGAHTILFASLRS
jgi:hypothetical protein